MDERERTYEYYNEVLKNRYIEYKEEATIMPNGFAQRVFDSTNKFESNLKKDISCFTFYEILDMYKTWSEVSLNVLSTKNSLLLNYTKWCLQQNLIPDSQNHFEEFNTEILRGCLNTALKNKQIVDRTEIIRLIQDFKNPGDKFIILGLFEGICGKEFSEFYDIKVSDFTVVENEVFVLLNSGRKIHVSKELYSLALSASEEEYYYSVGADSSFKFIPSDKIIKDFPNTDGLKDNFAQRVTSKIRRNMKANETPYITSHTLKESGRIDFIRKKAEEKGISPKEFLLEHCEELEEQFNCKVPARYTLYKKYKEYLN